MVLTKNNISNAGKLIELENEISGCNMVFRFREFNFYFSNTRSSFLPVDTKTSHIDGLPDYVLRLLHQIVVAYSIFVDMLNLPDILKEGRFYQSGARYLDVYLADIPVEHGYASSQVYPSVKPDIEKLESHGKSLKLTLHRGLSKKTLTPIHELFHLFQYNITPFNNIWFMEGLARWAQRLLNTTPYPEDPLPDSVEAIILLLGKWHEAESFWNRLDRICSAPTKSEMSFSSKDWEVEVNITLIEGGFMRCFFRHLILQTKMLTQEQGTRNLNYNSEWPRIEKRCGNNNSYIIRAILGAIHEMKPASSVELDNFVHASKLVAYPEQSFFSSANNQALMRVLKVLGIGKVYNRADGLLNSDYYEPVSKTLSVEELKFDEARSKKIDFSLVFPIRTLVGDLTIRAISDSNLIVGLEKLESIDGNISITETDLVVFNGLNSLKRVKGQITIGGNQLLQSINGLNSIKTIDRYLDIVDNPLLSEINGFNSLHEIKKGHVRVENSPKLLHINGLRSLIKARGVTLGQLALKNVDFLSRLFDHQPDFPGAIKITDCQISSLKGLSSLERTGSSLYLHGNRLVNLSGLENLKEVGASLSLSSNHLRSVSEIKNLTRVNGMLGLAFNQLHSLDGLENLNFLKTVKWGQQIRTIVLQGNTELADISSLKNIETEDSYIVMYLDDIDQYKVKPEVKSRFHKNILELHVSNKNESIFPTFHFVNKMNHDYSNFRKTTHNKLRVLLTDFETDADTLILSFSGLGGNLGGMFYNRYHLITNGIKTHKIFINDTASLWYLAGIPGITRDIHGTINLIEKLALHNKYRKIICIGASMGGYMSLLTGYLIGATHIVVFSPQTFLDEDNRKKYGDSRWSGLMKKLPKNIPLSYLDLSLLYRDMSKKNFNIQIHYSSMLMLDRVHVEHLGLGQNAEYHPYDVESHYITIYLDKLGMLEPIINKILD